MCIVIRDITVFQQRLDSNTKRWNSGFLSCQKFLIFWINGTIKCRMGRIEVLCNTEVQLLPHEAQYSLIGPNIETLDRRSSQSTKCKT